jgi:hypothetical protein
LPSLLLTSSIINGEAISAKSREYFATTEFLFPVESSDTSIKRINSISFLEKELKSLPPGSSEYYKKQAEIYRLESDDADQSWLTKLKLDQAASYEKYARDAEIREEKERQDKNKRDLKKQKAEAFKREKENTEDEWRILEARSGAKNC